MSHKCLSREYGTPPTTSPYVGHALGRRQPVELLVYPEWVSQNLWVVCIFGVSSTEHAQLLVYLAGPTEPVERSVSPDWGVADFGPRVSTGELRISVRESRLGSCGFRSVSPDWGVADFGP